MAAYTHTHTHTLHIHYTYTYIHIHIHIHTHRQTLSSEWPPVRRQQRERGSKRGEGEGDDGGRGGARYCVNLPGPNPSVRFLYECPYMSVLTCVSLYVYVLICVPLYVYPYMRVYRTACPHHSPRPCIGELTK